MTHIEMLRPILLQAGHLALQLRAEGLHTMQKEDGTPVTNADHAVSEFLTTELLAAFPDTKVVSEEHADVSGVEHPLTWVIDPIDGTKKYLAGRPQWCVMVALVDTAPICSMIYYPEGLVWYWAIRGQGAWAEIDGVAKRLRIPEPHEPLRIVHSADAPVQPGELGSYGFMKHARKILWDKIDVYVRGDIGYYDLVPPMLIVTEAGGACVDLTGKPITFVDRNAVQSGVLLGHPNAIASLLPTIAKR